MARYKLQVELFDAQFFTVEVDSRDFVAAEAEQMFDHSPNQITRNVFLAWHALTRTGAIKISWDKFRKQECVDVRVLEAAAAGADADSLDPGRPDQSGNG